jgi:hypothetical protein
MLLLYIVQEDTALTKIAHFSKIYFVLPAHESTVSVDSVAPASRIRICVMFYYWLWEIKSSAFR